jgi:cellulose synthase/poly-beta-1,6-N-acetylglucosamine synthase-like glycosyltransferase
MAHDFPRMAHPGGADVIFEEISGIGALLAAAGLPRADIDALPSGARALGAHIDQLIATGRLSQQLLLTQLALHCGAAFSLQPPPPQEAHIPSTLLGHRSYAAISAEGRAVQVIAPGGTGIVALARGGAERARVPLVITTRQGYIDAVISSSADHLAAEIATMECSDLSARHIPGRGASGAAWLRRAILIGLPILSLAILAFFNPTAAIILPPLLLAPVFIIAAIAVLACLLETCRPAMPEPPPLPATALPRYTVLVPLYGEANIVPDLIQRLSALDYPRQKLEILLLVEVDDIATREALRAFPLPPFMLFLTVPSGSPRTKPRALNAGLMAATGDLVVVFDAEDAPEPDQLRRAAALFASAPPSTACVQARLAIANARDCLITRRFAIDYAALFDCGKSGMARLDWPVPLGGSSNHFRTETLRKVGGWDAWNVTEDADLGIRLARMGYFVADLPSTTWEEAPNRLKSWMNQRTRWMKGWMQTMLVHARQPQRLVADLGLFRTVIVSSIGFSVVLGALLMPLFVIGIGWRLSDQLPLGAGTPLVIAADTVIIECLALGLLAEVLPAFQALRRRKALSLAPWILLAPITYALTSIAAWRALVELIRRPHHWHKTPHGAARSSGGLASLR